MVIPALNEAATIAAVIDAVAADDPAEIIVIDADSADDTARVAATAGARVLNWAHAGPRVPTRPGKGESLWRGVGAASGEVVVFIDADLTHPTPGMVRALTTELVDDSVHLVKADYQRTFHGQPTGGGRVTELTAKPLLRQFFPQLSHIDQPLAGEYAIRRATAWALPFVAGYGVEVGLLIDVARTHGPEAIRQASLGHRSHRNRPLAELAPMAEVVAQTILSRAGVVDLALPERPPLSDIM